MAEQATPKRTMSQEEIRRRKAAKEKKMKMLKRRRRIMIGAIVAVIVILVLIVCLVKGNHSKKTTMTTLTIGDKGEVTFQEITDFDKDLYDESELKSFVKDEIKEYNREKRGQISLKKLKVSGDEAVLTTEYSDVPTYREYTGYAVSLGTVQNMLDFGYDFSDAFVEITADGEKGIPASAETMTADPEMKALIIEENCKVVVPGTICYVTDAATTMEDGSTVIISGAEGNTDVTTQVIILYQ